MKTSTPSEALEWWVNTSEGRCMIEKPIRPEVFELAMQRRLEHAFAAGNAAAVQTTMEDEL